MSLSLTISDNLDGTGGTATIAGSTGGSANALYVARFTGVDEALSWALAGSRTGDGTITLTGPLRQFTLWYVKNTDGSTVSVSQVVAQALTDAAYASVRTRILEIAVAKLKALNLADIGQRVFLLNSDDDPGQQFPCVAVLRDVVPDQYTGGTNIRDDIGYPVQVLFEEQADRLGRAPAAKYDLWVERVAKAFRFQRLSGVDEVMTCTIEPARMPLQDKPSKLYLGAAGGMTLRFLARETRGITA